MDLPQVAMWANLPKGSILRTAERSRAGIRCKLGQSPSHPQARAPGFIFQTRLLAVEASPTWMSV